jgi:hypothetical protein
MSFNISYNTLSHFKSMSIYLEKILINRANMDKNLSFEYI